MSRAISIRVLEGWDIFDCGNEKLQIQRIDCPEEGEPKFVSDDAAIQHVVKMARDYGGRSHKLALTRIFRNAPEEAAYITQLTGYTVEGTR